MESKEEKMERVIGIVAIILAIIVMILFLPSNDQNWYGLCTINKTTSTLLGCLLG